MLSVSLHSHPQEEEEEAKKKKLFLKSQQYEMYTFCFNIIIIFKQKKNK
jgi:hypothetical protein